MSKYYGLDGEPITMDEWVKLFSDPASKIVAKTNCADDRYTVSTVYLGLDHGWGEGIKIFETMVFGSGPMDQECVRYATREQALEGHAEMVTRCEFSYACQFGGLS